MLCFNIILFYVNSTFSEPNITEPAAVMVGQVLLIFPLSSLTIEHIARKQLPGVFCRPLNGLANLINLFVSKEKWTASIGLQIIFGTRPKIPVTSKPVLKRTKPGRKISYCELSCWRRKWTLSSRWSSTKICSNLSVSVSSIPSSDWA